VLAHEIDHRVHGLDAVECRAPAFGRSRGMDREPAKPELAGDVREVGRGAGRVPITRMHRHHRVDVVEQAGAEHVDLARAALLGRCAVETQRSASPGRDQPLLDGNRRGGGGGAKQVMTAAVPRALGDHRAPFRFGGLRQAGQGLELADDADDRPAAAPLRGERGGDLGDAGRDVEARALQLLLQQGAALLFLVADFREAPDPQRDIAVHPRSAVEPFQYGKPIRGLRADGQLPNNSDNDESQQVTHRILELTLSTLEWSFRLLADQLETGANDRESGLMASST
jgi:hypothetical protein